MCDNCNTRYSWDDKPRDFTMTDLQPTLLKHGMDGHPISSYAFSAFVNYAQQFGLKREGWCEYATKQLEIGSGYNSDAANACAKLYKTGLVVLEELKKKGIKHQPRK